GAVEEHARFEAETLGYRFEPTAIWTVAEEAHLDRQFVPQGGDATQELDEALSGNHAPRPADRKRRRAVARSDRPESLQVDAVVDAENARWVSPPCEGSEYEIRDGDLNVGRPGASRAIEPSDDS